MGDKQPKLSTFWEKILIFFRRRPFLRSSPYNFIRYSLSKLAKEQSCILIFYEIRNPQFTVCIALIVKTFGFCCTYS